MSSTPKSVVYKTVDNVEISLDVYLPDNAKDVPVLLWFHGGGLLQGRRNAISPHHLRGVNKHNYAFVTADYRLAPQVGMADILEDVKDCIAFIRSDLGKHVENGSIDATRLAVSGSSAGGYLAFLAGLYADPKPNVILPIYPITDPFGYFFTTSQGTPFGPVSIEDVRTFADPSSQVMSYSDEDSLRNKMYFYMLKEANLASLLHVKPGDDTFRIAKQVYEKGLPPTYVVHGDADRAVGVEQSDEVVGVLAGLGKEVLYERLHGVDHLFDREEDVELEQMYSFLKEHL